MCFNNFLPASDSKKSLIGEVIKYLGLLNDTMTVLSLSGALGLSVQWAPHSLVLHNIAQQEKCQTINRNLEEITLLCLCRCKAKINMRETLEKKPTEPVTLKPGLKSSVSTFSADNESGYEDCDPSDAHDTISEVNDPDLSDVTETMAKPLEADQEADSLIETTSALTIDSSTR